MFDIKFMELILHLLESIKQIVKHSKQNKNKTISNKEAFNILGINNTSNFNKIKTAYKKKIKSIHPNKASNKKYLETFIKINLWFENYESRIKKSNKNNKSQYNKKLESIINKFPESSVTSFELLGKTYNNIFITSALNVTP